MKVEDLEERLRAGAVKVDEGRIRVDAKRALAKLRDFRLADPHEYVLELLRAAVVAGAPSVEVRVDADDCELSFEGATLSRRELQDLLDQALSGPRPGDAPHGHYLALGVAGALALNPKWIRITTENGTLEVRPPDAAELKRDAGPRGKTLVHVRERIGLRVLHDAVFTPAEVSLIRARAAHYPVPLWLNGEERVDRPLTNPDALAQVQREVDGAKVLVTLPRAKPHATRIAFEVLGTLVTAREVELPFLAVEACVRDDKLRLNASGSDVVDGDPRLRRIFDAIRSMSVELLVRLCNSIASASDRDAERLQELAVELKSRSRSAPGLPPEAQGALDRAKILPGPSGEGVSIAELRDELRAGRPLRFSRVPRERGSYATPAVLLDGKAAWVERVLPGPPKLDIEEEARAKRRGSKEKAHWARQPPEQAALTGGHYLATQLLDGPVMHGEVGLRSTATCSRVRLLVRGRFLQEEDALELAPLRATAVVDLDRQIPESVWGALPMKLPPDVVGAVREAALSAACSAASDPKLTGAIRAHGRDAVEALVRSGVTSAADVPEQLTAAELYPLAGGGFSSLDALGRQKELRYITAPWELPALDGQPVVVLEPAQREILRRLLPRGRLVSFADQLRAEVDIRRRLDGPRLAPVVVDQTCAAVELHGEACRGEVAIPAEVVPRLQLRILRCGVFLEETRQTARYETALATVDAPALTPDATWSHAVRDESFAAMLAEVRDAERKLAGALFAAHPNTPFDLLPAGARRYLVAFFRKELAKAAKDPAALDAAQAEGWNAPLFHAGKRLVSLAEIHEAGSALFSPDRISADLGGMVLRCDPDVAALVAALAKVEVRDAAPELERLRRLEEFRARTEREAIVPDSLSPRAAFGVLGAREEKKVALPPREKAPPPKRVQREAPQPEREKVAVLRAPLESEFREPLSGAGIEGEVALAQFPLERLRMQLLCNRSVLEILDVEHPVGGVAQVNSNALTPVRGWKRAARDDAFRAVRTSVEEALERALLRRLEQRDMTPAWREYGAAAIRWRSGSAGPLGELIPRLELFSDLRGAPVTVGTVLAEHARRHSVAVARASAEHAPPPDGPLVLADTEEHREYLQLLHLEPEDVTRELLRRRDLEEAIRERKLDSLCFEGEALLRLEVEWPDLCGELALPMKIEKDTAIVLARGGVAVDRYPIPELGVAGVLDSPELPVNENWTKATVLELLRTRILDAAERLFAGVAERALDFDKANLDCARAYALRFIAFRGVRAPAQLDGLFGTGAALADAPLFRAADGRRISLRSIADQVAARGHIALVLPEAAKARTPHLLALLVDSFDAFWIACLELVLGKGTLQKVRSPEQWAAFSIEAEISADPPLAEGLARLRREAKLLRADAFGRLGREVLEEIQLRPRRGKVAVEYDRESRVVFLDPDHPKVREALVTSAVRPDHLYVLLAFVYAEVNRVLEEVTDDDERRLAGALLAHLSANPHLLEAEEPERARG